MITIEGMYVTPSGNKKYGRISVRGGKIASVGEAKGNASIMFPRSCIIFPGFVDAHVHAREDRTEKWSHKEDFATAGRAALNGGVTAFMEMPNTPAPVVSKAEVASRRKLAKKSLVPVVISAALRKGSAPIAGVDNYKAFLTKSVGDIYFTSTDDFAAQLKKYREKKVHVHCEDHGIIEHDAARPAQAEVKAVKETLALAKKLRLRVHICHLSTKGALARVRRAKRQGVKVTTEATPHHLFFDAKNRRTFRRAAFLKMNPPLRTPADRRALLAALRRGDIDIMATDHAPHTIAEKRKHNLSGVPQLDTVGPFACWLIKAQKFTLGRIADACSRLPAKLLGLNQGEIRKGMDASFTVLDLGKTQKVSAGMLRTKCAWSPFEGVALPGVVEATIVRGRVYLVGQEHEISRLVLAQPRKRAPAHEN